MPKKNERLTSNSTIVNCIRRLWLYSKERKAAVKDQNNRCQRCATKGIKNRFEEIVIQVHHRKGEINWEKIINFIREEVLVDPSELELLCGKCHDMEHGKTSKKRSDREGIPEIMRSNKRKGE